MFFEMDKDDFWIIDKLVPPKKTVSHPTERTVVCADFKDIQQKNEENPELNLTAQKRKMVTDTYVPSFNPLIKKITVSKYETPFDFYDSFRKAALLFYDVKGEVSPFVPFYSYMPQYSQLTPEQRAYYFYFRDELRHGVYIKTDYSYVYLYVYEILNLPDKIPPKEGIIRLCRLWGAYRKALPNIDKYFSIWVQDYCLLYGLTPPYMEMAEYHYRVAEKSSFSEFFFSLADISNKEGFSFAIRAFSDYDPRCGKFTLGTEQETYEKYFRLCLTPVLQDIISNGAQTCEKRSVITRDTFVYSLCTQKVKARLTVEYCPLSQDIGVRQSVSAAVRYTENCMRAALGVRSRLAVRDLDLKYKNAIDAFFVDIMKEAKRRAEEKNKPAYEKKYDAESVGFSFRGADEIEEKSWATTLKLVDEETKNELLQKNCSIRTEEPTDVVEKRDNRTFGLSEEDVRFLESCQNNAQKASVQTDTKAERINSAFSEQFGDVVLESDGDFWHVIEDYRKDTEEWIKQYRA